MLTKSQEIQLLLTIYSNTNDADEQEAIARTILTLNAELKIEAEAKSPPLKINRENSR